MSQAETEAVSEGFDTVRVDSTGDGRWVNVDRIQELAGTVIDYQETVKDLYARVSALHDECDNLARAGRPGNPYEWCARELARILRP